MSAANLSSWDMWPDSEFLSEHPDRRRQEVGDRALGKLINRYDIECFRQYPSSKALGCHVSFLGGDYVGSLLLAKPLSDLEMSIVTLVLVRSVVLEYLKDNHVYKTLSLSNLDRLLLLLNRMLETSDNKNSTDGGKSDPGSKDGK